ncbi:MAG: DUF445 family protein [Bernardetiaceae bacterium]|nr:DUF445 family protein [Bernardetiaceae bacterium]
MWGALVAKILSGSVVGYTTNDLAIQMLFRKRFGLGGIFLKTRDEFIENISKVVERDIINDRTLKPELESEKFKQALHNTVAAYLAKDLQNQIGEQIKIGDIPALDTSFEKLRQRLYQNLKIALAPIFQKLLSNIPINEALSEAQWKALSQKLIAEALKELEEKKTIRRLIRDLYEEISNEKAEAWLDKDLRKSITDAIKQITQKLPGLLSEHYKDDTAQIIDGLYKDLDLEKLIGSLSESLVEKNVAQLIGQQNTEAVSQELLQVLRTILKSEEGEKFLDIFSNYLIQTLEGEEKTIFELLSDDLRKRIEDFFKGQFPPILIKVIGWLYSRQRELEQLIDTTFSKNVDSKLKEWLLRVFIGSVSQRANAIGKITEIVERYRKEPEAVAKQLSEQVVHFLQSRSIGSIVKGLKDQKTALTLTKILRRNLLNALDNLDAQSLSFVFDTPLQRFVSAELMANFFRRNLRRLLDTELKEKFVFSPQLADSLYDSLESRLERAASRPIKGILSAEQIDKLSIEAESKLLDLIKRKSDKIAHFLSQHIPEEIEGKSWGVVVSSQQVSEFADFASDMIDKQLREGFEQRKQDRMATYLETLNEVPLLADDIAEILHKTLLSNLDTLLDGRIEMIIKNNLTDQSPNQIRDIVERFMGKELKPITRLGAFWGAIAGGGLAAMPNFQHWAAQSGVATAAYGVTGMATNWIALRMIFQPYTKKRIFHKIPVPFTPGVVIQNQPRFAQSMGNFVSDKLMNQEGLRKSFDKARLQIEQQIIALVCEDEYARIRFFIEKNQSQFAPQLTNKAYNLLEQKQPEVVKALLDAADNYRHYNLESIDTASLEEAIWRYLMRPRTGELITEALVGEINDFFAERPTLSEALPESLREILYRRIGKWADDELLKFVENLDSEKQLPKLLKPVRKQFGELMEKDINDFLSEAQRQEAQQYFGDYLASQLKSQSNQDALYDFLNQKLSEQISADTKISEVLNGTLLKLINQNFDFIIQKILETGTDWLKTERYELARQVYNKAFEEQKTVFLYKDTIEKTVLELCTKGVPEFLHKERESLSRLINGEINRMGEVKLGEVGVSVKTEFLKERISSLLGSERTEEAARDLAKALSNSIFDIPLKNFFQSGQVDVFEQLQLVLKQEFGIATQHLKMQYYSHKNHITEKPKKLLFQIIDRLIQESDTMRLDRILPPSQIQRTTDKVFRSLLSSDAFEWQSRRLIGTLFTNLKSQPLERIIDWNLMKTDLDSLIRNTLTNTANRQFITDSVSTLIERNATGIFQDIQPQTKDYIAYTLSAAALASLDQRLPEIISAINIRGLVVYEIEKMSPESIEALFYSFAKKYFDKLIQYGFGFGMAFGLAMDLSLGWLLREFGS